MADLVQANEFVFTPSAFICAFIEQESDTETTTETNVFGAVDKSIAPQDVDPIIKRSSINFGPMDVASPNPTASEPFVADDQNANEQFTPLGSPKPYFNSAKERFFARVDGSIDTDVGATITIKNTAEGVTNPNPNLLGGAFNLTSGLQDLGNAIQITGDVTSLVGVNETAQSRTDTKTITKTKGSQDTVVLVLTYGQFRSQCANPQATVDAIYNQVLSYFNSL